MSDRVGWRKLARPLCLLAATGAVAVAIIDSLGGVAEIPFAWPLLALALGCVWAVVSKRPLPGQLLVWVVSGAYIWYLVMAFIAFTYYVIHSSAATSFVVRISICLAASIGAAGVRVRKGPAAA